MGTTVLGAAVPALPPQGRVISEAEFSAMLKQLRLARACINNIETFLENVYINGMSVPLDKEVVIATPE